jgi:hypothetical protein
MHHFTTSIADYCQNTAIAKYWQGFDSVIRQVETHINKNDYDKTLQVVKSQDYLRILHAQTMDMILQALGLKRKQAELTSTLYDVFEVILQFAAFVRVKKNMTAKDTKTATGFDELTTRRYDEVFSAKLTKFLELLEDSSRSPSFAGASELFDRNQSAGGSEEITMFEHLLLKLDMFGYWKRKRGSHVPSYSRPLCDT